MSECADAEVKDLKSQVLAVLACWVKKIET